MVQRSRVHGRLIRDARPVLDNRIIKPAKYSAGTHRTLGRFQEPWKQHSPQVNEGAEEGEPGWDITRNVIPPAFDPVRCKLQKTVTIVCARAS